MLDFAAIAKDITAVLTDIGTPMVVKRQGESVGSAPGIFVKSRSTLDNTASMVQTIVGTRSLVLGRMARSPQVGDIVTTDGTDYAVQAVELVRPTNITLAYRLDVA